jgi:membrane protein DedA with SNARE-associated domain
MAAASAVWYGLISYLAFKAGSDWDALTAMIARSGRVAAIAAVTVIALGVLVWLVRRRREQAGG